MTGGERREQILQMLKDSVAPISGRSFAGTFRVSRQVIVQDMALLRAKGAKILSTTRGYVLVQPRRCSRVFKEYHTADQVREELETIVDAGGEVEDVFVYHRVYGVVRGALHIRSRQDIDNYVRGIESGKSRCLLETTSGYHYHTVCAPDEAALDLIQERLSDKGFLAKLKDFEPVDFWNKKKTG